jgi:hypothetical protein
VVEIIFKLLSNGHSFNTTTLNQALNARDFEKITGLNPMISCVQDFYPESKTECSEPYEHSDLNYQMNILMNILIV